MRKRIRLKGSSSASDRSRLMRRTTKAHSFSLRNRQDLCARSGKSTSRRRVKTPITPVIYIISTGMRSGEVGGWGSTYHSLHDEDPSPASQALDTTHLRQTESKNTRQGRGNTSNKIENRKTFLDVVYIKSVHRTGHPERGRDTDI